MTTVKPIKSFIHDDSGVAYGIFAVAAFIILMGTVIVWYTPIFNQFLTVFNIFIDQGMVSQDTSDAMEFNGFIVAAMVAFVLFGVACWGTIRALEKRRSEGF